MMSYVLITPPSIEPVSLDEVKAQARIEGDAEDSFLESLTVAARQWVENYTGRCLMRQGWRLWMDREPEEEEIRIGKVPLLSVQQVQSFGEDDVVETHDLSAYYTDTAHEPGRLCLRSGSVWPSPSRLTNGISVDFEAGYGDEAEAVPEAMRLAVKQLATHWAEHRGDSLEAGLGASIPISVYALLLPYRIRSWR